MPVNLNLNLLPENLQVSKGLDKTLKTIKALGVISVVAFAVFCLVVIALFIITNMTLTSTQASVNQLKTQVKAMETSEQQLILLKDRLAKITAIKVTPNASKNIVNVNSLFTNVSPVSVMSLASINPSKVDLSFLIRSNEDLSVFMQDIKGTTLFNSVGLTSMTYSPAGGFSVDVSLENK